MSRQTNESFIKELRSNCIPDVVKTRILHKPILSVFKMLQIALGGAVGDNSHVLLNTQVFKVWGPDFGELS